KSQQKWSRSNSGFQQLTNLENLEFRFDCENECIEGAKELVISLGKLVKLKDLSYSIFQQYPISQEVSKELSNSLKNLNKLERFQLEDLENFQDQLTISYYADLFNYTPHLLQLNLKINTIEKHGEYAATCLAKSLQNLINLTDLKITVSKDCNIGENGCSALAQSIIGKRNLTNLVISIQYNNKIGNKGAVSIGEALGELKQLQFFQLIIQNQNEIYSEGARAIAEGIQQISNLINLDISINYNDQISQKGMASFGSALSQLNLHLKGQNYYVFGDILGSLSQIVKLDLNLRVPVSEESVNFEQIAHGIKNLVSIQDLNLSFVSSGLNENSYKLFVDIFERLINLKKLYLLIVQMKSGVLEYIGKSFLHLQNLESLNLNLELLNMSDQFIDKEIIALGNGISHLINLTELSLDLILDVRASNDSINSIAKGIKSLKNLEKLYANLNNRSGQVLDILTYIDSFNYLQNAELRIGKNSYFQKINQKVNLGDQKNSTENEIEEELQLKSKNEPNCLSLKSLEVICYLPQNNFGGYVTRQHISNNWNFNQINQDGAYNLSQGIKSLSGLRSIQLYLEGCNIQRQGAILIGDSLSYLTRLKTLQLLIVQDKIQSDGAVAIGRAIKNLYDLNELKIQIGEQNEIKKIGAYEIGVGMQFLTNLTHLRLIIKDNNDIESDGISSICKSISKMIYLKYLYLNFGNQNQIQSSIIYEISQAIKQLANLKYFQIDIHINEITSNYISEITDLIRLINSININFIYQQLDNTIKCLITTESNRFCYLDSNITIKSNIYYSKGICQNIFQPIESINQIPSIKILEIQVPSTQNLDQEICYKLGDSLKQLLLLENLQINFGENEIGFHVLDLGNSLSKLANLKHLQLNNISEIEIKLIGSNLCQLYNLESFVLELQFINNIAFHELRILIKSITTLQKLKLVKIKQSYSQSKTQQHTMLNLLVRKIKNQLFVMLEPIMNTLFDINS
ncbi:hypothetical protein ABPG72_020526, partial [Tetrahymena utriculariae]